MTRLDRMTYFLNRHAWSLWIILLGSLGVTSMMDITPMASPSTSGVGDGLVVFDVAVTILTIMAALLLVPVIACAKRHISFVAAADWTQLFALAVAGSRLTWMLVVHLDATLTIPAMVALAAFATSSIFYSIGRLARARTQYLR